MRPLGAALLAVAKATVASVVVDAVRDPRQRKFHGKAMRVRSLGYLGMMLAVPAAWWLRRREEPYPVGADLMISVPLLIDAGGNWLGLYDRAHLDDVVHFANAAILMTAFGAAVSPRVSSRREAVALTIGAGAAGTVGWEVMEYLGERAGFRGMNLTYEDTVLDAIESFGGCLVAASITAARWQPKTERKRT